MCNDRLPCIPSCILIAVVIVGEVPYCWPFFNFIDEIFCIEIFPQRFLEILEGRDLNVDRRFKVARNVKAVVIYPAIQPTLLTFNPDWTCWGKEC